MNAPEFRSALDALVSAMVDALGGLTDAELLSLADELQHLRDLTSRERAYRDLVRQVRSTVREVTQ